jgi:hypothetical protein
MITNTAGRALLALVSVVAIGALAGCSSPGTVKKGCRTEAHLIDTTGSTTGYRQAWPAELTRSAHDTLVKGDRFVASTFTSGAGTVDWTVSADACHSPETRPHKHERWATTQATVLGPKLTALTRAKTHGGSDPLAALEATTQLSRLSTVRIWSDFVIQDDGVDLSRRVPARQLSRLADEWAPRLRGLNGVTVIALHPGRGIDSDDAVRQSQTLLRTVLERVGARLVWQPVIDPASDS